jgi:putative ABC transport system permease protein
MRLLHDLARDALHGARMLRRTPAFTLTAMVVLAAGIGANTAVFSVVNAVLLQPLPYPQADRILQLLTVSREGRSTLVSVPKFNVWREHTRGWQALAAYQVSDPGVNVTSGDRPEHLRAMHVSAEYFAVFGARIRSGRSFTAEEDRVHGPRLAVISHGLWIRRFGSEPSVVNTSIELGGERWLIVGVLAQGFVSDPAADIFLPLQADPFSTDHVSYLTVVGRLQPGVTPGEMRRRVVDTTFAFRRTFPFALGAYDEFTAAPLRDVILGDVRPALQLLTGAVLFVLLIACANVANLMLARGHRRRREVATRLALGAGGGRIVRQLLTESVLLAISGGLLGLVAGYGGLRAMLAWAPPHIPRIASSDAGIAIDGSVLLFTTIVSLATGVLFGVLPALTAARTNVTAVFNETGHAAGGGSARGTAQAALVVGEMTLALILLVGAGLMIRTFLALGSVDRGFDARNVVTLDMSLAGTPLGDTEALAPFIRNAEDRIHAIHGVAHVAAARTLPLEPAFDLPFVIERRVLPHTGGTFHGIAAWRSVTPEYFDAFRIRLRHGRAFTRADMAGGIPVAIVNDAMVRKYWPAGTNPLRERLVIGVSAGREHTDAPRRIVGVVDDVRDTDVNRLPEPIVYVPMAQVSDAMSAWNNRRFPLRWIVRSSVRASTLVPRIEAELRATSGGLPIARVRTMEEIVAGALARAAFSMTLLTAFAAVSLLLAVLGLYGLMSYSVQQRTQEIGIRMALGAAPAEVRAMVLLQGARLALTGVGLGIVLALALTRLMASLVFGVRTHDPSVFALVAGLLTAVALVAAYLPARRATRIDPLRAVRG